MTAPKETVPYCETFETTPSPHQNDGDFLSQKFLNPVKKGGIEFKSRPERHHDVVFYDHDITMENGARYQVVVADIPDRKAKVASDVANLETTAWTTKPDGFNKLRMRKLAEFAIPSVFVSVLQNKTKLGDITKNAHNELEILKALAPYYDLDQEYALTGGVSRGGMTSQVVGSVAAEHGVNIPYIDANVPARPNSVKLAHDLGHLARSLPHEAKALYDLKDIPPRDLRQYVDTIDLSLCGLWRQVKEVGTLLSGDVGRRIDETLPRSTFAYISAYRNDMFTNGDEWRERFDDDTFPNVIIDTSKPGAHMSCVGAQSRADWTNRMSAVAEVLHSSPSARRLDSTSLRFAAAEINPCFRKQGDSGLLSVA